MMQKNLVYIEEQKFNQKWIIAILVIVFLIFFWGIIQQELFDLPFGNNPVSSVNLFLFSLIPVGFLYLIENTKMTTKIFEDSISIRIKPFHFKEQTFLFDDMEKIYAREYRPIAEFGGWGIRYGLKGKAYNMSGNTGIQIIFKNGKHLLIGSKKSLEIENAIKRYTIASEKIGK